MINMEALIEFTLELTMMMFKFSIYENLFTGFGFLSFNSFSFTVYLSNHLVFELMTRYRKCIDINLQIKLVTKISNTFEFLITDGMKSNKSEMDTIKTFVEVVTKLRI